MSKYPAIVVHPTAASMKTQDPFQWSWAWPNSNSMVIEEITGDCSVLMVANDAVISSITDAESQVTCIMQSAGLQPVKEEVKLWSTSYCEV